MAAVSHWRVRGEAAVLLMIAFVRSGDPGHSLPQCLAGLPVQAHHDELVLFARAGSSAHASASRPASSGILWLLRLWRGLSDFASRDGRGQKDPVAPDHRRGKATAR